MSENTAATTVTGQAPKKPLKKRLIRIVWISFPVAQPMEKMENPNMDKTNGRRRPCNSDRGAQRDGPDAKPRI
jgi:hypothetical protein